MLNTAEILESTAVLSFHLVAVRTQRFSSFFFVTEVLESTAVLSGSLGGNENLNVKYNFVTEILESRAVLNARSLEIVK